MIRKIEEGGNEKEMEEKHPSKREIEGERKKETKRKLDKGGKKGKGPKKGQQTQHMERERNRDILKTMEER